MHDRAGDRGFGGGAKSNVRKRLILNGVCLARAISEPIVACPRACTARSSADSSATFDVILTQPVLLASTAPRTSCFNSEPTADTSLQRPRCTSRALAVRTQYARCARFVHCSARSVDCTQEERRMPADAQRMVVPASRGVDVDLCHSVSRRGPNPAAIAAFIAKSTLSVS